MDTPSPQKLQVAAVTQIVVGAIDMLVGWWLASMVGLCAGSALTSPCMCIGLPPIGAMCGMLGFAVIPIGVFELIAGIVGLTNPKTGATVLKISSIFGIAGLLVGSVTSALAGVITLIMMRDPEVTAYLEGKY
jgi:hypothetical protein